MRTTGPVLVTGGTGNTGRAALNALDPGIDVRATIRRESDAAKLPTGVEPVVADFADPDSMRRALAGVQVAYLVTPSSEQAESQQIDFAEAAASLGVERIVLLSQLGAQVDSPVRFLHYHGVVEDHIKRIGLGFTFLRPNLFFQALLAFAGQIASTGQLGAPVGAARVSAIDVQDIGEVAAQALVDDAHAGAVYTLTGPAALTHAQMAQSLAAATDRDIRFADVPATQFAEALCGVLPAWQVEGLVEDYAHYSRGEAAEVTDAVRHVTGHEARSFAEFARNNAAAFR